MSRLTNQQLEEIDRVAATLPTEQQDAFFAKVYALLAHVRPTLLDVINACRTVRDSLLQEPQQPQQEAKTIYDQRGTPRFYFDGVAVYEHGSGGLIAAAPDVPRGHNYGLQAHWIDGGLLHPDLAGQQFYYDADPE